MKKSVIIIGAGFSGMAAAATLAQQGFNVKVFEKHDLPGGRARYFKSKGFTFDMGPSWYWMPDVFERFFNRFGKSTSDYYQLDRVDPSYRVFWSDQEIDDVPADREELFALFERYEPNAASALESFLEEARIKYEIGINDLVYKPGFSPLEYADLRIAKFALKFQIFQSFYRHTKKYFTDERIMQLLEFPILFLGGTAKNTPALYSLMNYADMMLGTWYPKGGMYKVVEGIFELCKSLGVEFIFNADVQKILTEGKKAIGISTDAGDEYAEFVISSADYNFTEKELLPEKFRNYSHNYWENKTMSPSSLIFYLGINKKLENLEHHNLFFDTDFEKHASEIYTDPKWPENPSIYLSCPSKSDQSVAPGGSENMMILIPIAAGLEDSESLREKYFELFLQRFEKLTGESIRDNIVYKRTYSLDEFSSDYNAFKGNAYGLANTLRQTAFLKPGLRNKKLPNLFYTGQLTVPGPGVPPALISGQIVADLIVKHVKTKVYERVI